MLRDRVGALVAERVQLADQGFALDPFALGDAAGELADAERRQHPLEAALAVVTSSCGLSRFA